MYDAVHKLHVSILLERYRASRHRDLGYTLVDIGSSTGRLFREICNQLQLHENQAPPGMAGYAIDPSHGMMDQLTKHVPWVTPYQCDVLALDESAYPVFGADAVNASYVLQFIHPDYKRDALQTMYRMLKPGGLLFMAQKDIVSQHSLGFLLNESYDTFKTDNGYSREEIDAKTEALRGSMWPYTQAKLLKSLYEVGFRDIMPTTRWCCFSSLVARRY
jgi:tRNA (cmo5U34)-methyltransferase